MIFGITGCEFGVKGNWEPTSELNIEMLKFENSVDTPMYKHLQAAADRFRLTYPDVQLNVTEITVSNFNDTSYHEALGARLMAGDGPDVLFIDDHFMVTHDVLKMQKAGAFEDLTQKLAEDISLDSGEYVRAVFDGTAFDGHNYLIPLGYTLPLFLTTEKNMAESGIDFAGSKDTVAMLTQLGDYWEREKDKENPAYTLCDPRPIYWSPHFAGLTYGDFQTGEARMDFDVLRQIIDQWKRIAPHELAEHSPVIKDYLPEQLSHIDLNNAFQSGTLTCTLGSTYGYMNYFFNMQMIDSELSPRFYPLRNMNGGITAQLESALAVRRGSPNAQNAWNFIKIAISEEVQTSLLRSGLLNRFIPVNRTAGQKVFATISQNPFDSLISGTTISGQAYEASMPPFKEEQYAGFVRLQDEIDRVFIRFPLDQEVFHKFDPYVKGTATFEECRKEAEDFMFIYLSE